MANIDKIPGITTQEIQALRSQDVKTTTALWGRVGADFDQGISTLAGQADLEPQRLVELLKLQALQEMESGRASWPARHWLELVLFALLLLVAGLFLYARSTAALSWAAAPIGWGLPGQVRQVYAVRDLPPYHRILPQDLADEMRPARSGAVSDPAGAVGRFTLQEVASGSVLLSGWLSAPVPASPRDYSLVSLPVAAHMLSLVSPGEPFSFILAPRQPGLTCQGAAAPMPALLLSTRVEADGASIIAAIPSSQLDLLQRCLGFSDVLLVK